MRRNNHGPAKGTKVKKKNVRQYIVVVDGYRRPSRCRNTTGRYRVGARNPKEAEGIVRKAIGFGSIQCYYEEKPDRRIPANKDAAYGECFIEHYNSETKQMELYPVRHANDPIR